MKIAIGYCSAAS